MGALFLGGGNLVDYRACGIIQVSTLEAEERKKNGEKNMNKLRQTAVGGG